MCPALRPPAAKSLQVERLVHEDSRVEGVEYTAQDGSRQRLGASAVILATGGFGASAALLQKYAPEVGVWVRGWAGGRGGGGEGLYQGNSLVLIRLLMLPVLHPELVGLTSFLRTCLPCLCLQAARLPTTNGPWAQGEGLELAREAGASLLHLDRVQVHPTGFVDPADPASGTKVGSACLCRAAPAARLHTLQVTAAAGATCPHAALGHQRVCVCGTACLQFLAPEKLRGVGGILLDAGGQRFMDELSTRDKVSQASGHRKDACTIVHSASLATSNRA